MSHNSQDEALRTPRGGASEPLGSSGPPGSHGHSGPPGPPGLYGPYGPYGASGASGSSGPRDPPGLSGPRDPSTFRGIPAPRPGIDHPIFYSRGNAGVYDVAFYPPAQESSQQPASHGDAAATSPRPNHPYGCCCQDCRSYYNPNNYFISGTHDPAGHTGAHHPDPSGAHHPGPGGAAPQTHGTGVYTLDRAGLEALNLQAQNYMHQTATSQHNLRVPQMQYLQPPFQPGPAHGQVPVQGQHQGPARRLPPRVEFNERELKELQAYRERKAREERVRRFREQNERAIGFNESDDEEFIPNIKNP
ncbi:hypothetical protein F5Y00DRAFT_268327 [Daldinia vernicosa]|uniref:uncharacterized protein n=1 Tax=Daldinia vernicosa TaxID=114800 RepID=UPI002007ABA7|nr:uncharacterized protein F5Y00DRAFT_268327 [Daldinia vernicosa]KAI0850578.1 hypothetical protein F5Y00DRAFT_268327 [Daldinia vernicosa]